MMLSKLARLGRSRILTQLRKKVIITPKLTKRTFFSREQEAQKHAEKYWENFIAFQNAGAPESHDFLDLNTDDVHWSINKLNAHGKNQFRDGIKGILKGGKMTEANVRLRNFSSQSLVYFFNVKFEGHEGERAFNSGINIVSTDKNGKVRSLATQDLGSVGPTDIIMGMTDPNPFFNSMQDAEKYLQDQEKLLNDDMRNRRFGNDGKDSLFYQKLFKPETKCFRDGKVFGGKGFVKMMHEQSLVSKSAVIHSHISNYGPFTFLDNFKWFVEYNDGTRYQWGGQQAIFVDDQGKCNAIHVFLKPDELKYHEDKVKQLLNKS